MGAESSELERLRREYQGRRHDERYSYLDPARLLELQQRERLMLDRLRASGLHQLLSCRILDVGCGRGDLLQRLLGYGAFPAHLHGIDLMPERIAEARRLIPHANLVCGDCSRLPYPDLSFDIVAQFVVLSSILDEGLKEAMAGEMRRVLRPDGLILWYDFWINSINRRVRGISPAEIRRLFPGCSVEIRRTTLAPPLARLLAPRSILLCQIFERLPFLLTHLLAVIRPL